MPYGPSSQSQPYATIAQLVLNGMSQQALNAPSISSSAVQDAHLLAASETVDSYLRQQFQLPLKQWGSDIVRYTCWIAAYSLVCMRGFNPQSEADGIYETNYNKAISWLKDVAKALASPDITDSSTSAAPGVQAPAAQPTAASPSNNRTRGTWAR